MGKRTQRQVTGSDGVSGCWGHHQSRSTKGVKAEVLVVTIGKIWPLDSQKIAGKGKIAVGGGSVASGDCNHVGGHCWSQTKDLEEANLFGWLDCPDLACRR